MDCVVSAGGVPREDDWYYEHTQGRPKALINIAGKPMVQWVYERSVQANRVDDVAVATDDQRIVDAVETFGGKAMMTSDKNRSGTDRVAEAAAIMGLTPDDIIINVQGDQPLLDPRSLDQVVSPFFNEPDIEMSTLGFPIVNEREMHEIAFAFDTLMQACDFIENRRPSDWVEPFVEHLNKVLGNGSKSSSMPTVQGPDIQ